MQTLYTFALVLMQIGIIIGAFQFSIVLGASILLYIAFCFIAVFLETRGIFVS